MSEEKKHPMQPVITDNGVRRFKRNEIVDFIVMNGSINLNEIGRASCRERVYVLV